MRTSHLKTVVFLLVCCFSSVSLSQQSAEDQKEKAAADKFLELLLKRPAPGTALERVFGYHAGQGTIEQLIERLSTTAQASPEDQSGRTWFLVGLLELQRGEDARAVQSLAKASQLLKNNSSAAFHYGQALLLIGDMQRAVIAFEEAIARRPNKSDYLAAARELGRQYQHQGNAEDALRVWNKLEQDFPGDDTVLQRIAMTLAEEGDLPGALQRYESLIKQAKNENDRVSFALDAANLQSQLGKQSAAIERLDSLLLKLRPGSYLYDEARRRIERIYLSTGDYAGLAKYYKRAIETHPDDLNIVQRFARTLAIQGKTTEAIRQFEAAIARAPNDLRLRLGLVDTLTVVGRVQDAASQYESLLAAEPNHPDYLIKYGQLLLADTQTAEAERKSRAQTAWMRLLDHRAGQANVHAQVADLLRSAKIEQAAIEQYRLAISLSPDEPQYKEYLGEYLYQLKRVDEALDTWRSMAAGSARTRDNLMRLAEVMHQFGQRSEALATMAQACQMKPTVSQRLRYVEWLNETRDFPTALTQLDVATAEASDLDEKSRVFSAAVKTYKEAGQLAQRIQEATATIDLEPTSQHLRHLAILHEAAGQPAVALAAITRAVKVDPGSIENLDMAARLAQETGQLVDAIEMRKRLAEIDRRFRTVHLQQLATLYLRSGQRDLALAASKEMLAGADGATEAFRFHADLCGSMNLSEQRLETLRRCMQLNPRNSEAIQWLAKDMADNFKTEQAIELYWRVHDGTESPDQRREVVIKLAELHRRSNRLDQLISRLELRGRESGDRRATADMVASAYQAAGDLGLARQTLEAVWSENPQDTLLLSRLIGICQQAGDIERAIELQRELLRLAPDEQASRQLASLLLELGETDQAMQIWLTASGHAADVPEVLKQLQRLYERRDEERALTLVNRALESNSQSWELRCVRMILLAATDEWDDCQIEASNILAATLAVDTPALIAASASRYDVRDAQLRRVEGLGQVAEVARENYQSWGQRSLPIPSDFGQARAFALYLQLSYRVTEDPSKFHQQLDQLKQRALAKDATIQDAWDWVTARTAGEILDQVHKNYADPESWQDEWRAFELDPVGSWPLIRANLSYRAQVMDEQVTTVALRDVDEPIEASENQQYQPLSVARLRQIASFAQLPPDDQYRDFPWPIAYAYELKLAGQDAQAELVRRDFQAQVLTPEVAVERLSYYLTHADDDELWKVMTVALDVPATDPQAWVGDPLSLVKHFLHQDRVENKRSQGWADAKFQQRVFQLLDISIQRRANQPNKQIYSLDWLGQARTLDIDLHDYGNTPVEVAFPPQGAGPDDEFLSVLYLLLQQSPAQLEAWTAELVTSPTTTPPGLIVERLITAACIRYWQQRSGDAVQLLQSALKVAVEHALAAEFELRLMLVDLYLRDNRKTDALDMLDRMAVRDQSAMMIHELSAVRLAIALDSPQRAAQAVKRLLNVRLSVDRQTELANVLVNASMTDLADELMRRVRYRTGNTVPELQQLLRYFDEQKQQAQALEVALEIFYRTNPRRSGGARTDSSSRNLALRVLQAAGKLPELIASAEKRYEHAPQSRRLQAELIELYNQVSDKTKLDALTKQIELSSSQQGVQGLIEAAIQRSRSQEYAAACDLWLQAIQQKPSKVSPHLTRVVNDFEQADRLHELIDAILQAGTSKFATDNLGWVLRKLSLKPELSAAAVKLLLTIMDSERYQRDNNREEFFWYRTSDWLDEPAVLQKQVDQLVVDSLKSAGQWSQLFDGMSYSRSSGRDSPLCFCIQHAKGNPQQLAWIKQRIERSLDQNPQWFEGSVALGLVAASQGKLDRALELLSPVAQGDFNPPANYSQLWCLGSQIDMHPSLQPLALQMYRLGMSRPDSSSSSLTFQYTMKFRVYELLMAMDQKSEAVDLLAQELDRNIKGLEALAKGARSREAQLALESTSYLVALLNEVGASRRAMKSLGRIDLSESIAMNNLRTEVNLYQTHLRFTRQALLSEGTKALIDSLDLEKGSDSLFLELVRAADQAGESISRDTQLLSQLNHLQTARPADLNLQIARAIVESTSDNLQPLESMLQQARTLHAVDKNHQASVEKILMVACLRWQDLLIVKQPDDAGHLISQMLKQTTIDWDHDRQATLYTEVAKGFMSCGQPRATELVLNDFSQLPDRKISHLLDLASLSIEHRFLKLAQNLIEKAADIWYASAADNDGVGSLSALLGTEEDDDEFTDDEAAALERLVQLVKLWDESKLDSSMAYNWLGRWLMPAGKPMDRRVLQYMITDSEIEFDGLFDRLAKYAAAAGGTDAVVHRLRSAADKSPGSESSATLRLMSSLALLRHQESKAAIDEIESIPETSLRQVPYNLMGQFASLALANEQSRTEGMRAVIKYLESLDKQQHTAATDELFKHVAAWIIEYDLGDQPRDALARLWTDAVAEGRGDNPRLNAQFEAFSLAYLKRSQLASSLEWLGKRGFDYTADSYKINDPLGQRTLQLIATFKDKQQAYRMLADWTFAGDDLRFIVVASPTAYLPQWIKSDLLVNEVGFSIPSSPVVSSFDLLARLARATDSMDDLMQRLTTSQMQGKQHAHQAKAIALAVCQRPVPDDLRAAMTRHLQAIKPGSRVGKDMRDVLIFAQLGVLLSEVTSELPWSREVLSMVGQRFSGFWRPIKHGTLTYHREHGWSQDDSLEQLQSCQELLRRPVDGNFTLQFEASVDEQAGFVLSVDGLNFELDDNEERHLQIAFNRSETQTVYLPKIRHAKWEQHRVVRDESKLSYFIDDELCFSERRGPGPVWLSIQRKPMVDFNIRNVQLLGQPRAAEVVDMIPTDSLRNWTGEFLSLSLPSGTPNQRFVQSHALQFEESADRYSLKDLYWSVSNGELISGLSKTERTGGQSVIHYQHPLQAGDRIEYEFYYSPGKNIVHPCLGQTVFMLQPEGVRLHQLNRLDMALDIPPSHPTSAQSAVPLQLKSDQWNKLELIMQADRVTLRLNGQPILNEPLDANSHSPRFGLFHNPKHNAVRVRHAVAQASSL